MDNEFADMMPHKIKVWAFLGPDDFGGSKYSTDPKIYSCLLDETNTARRNVNGVELTLGLVAYTFAIPDGETEPVSISPMDRVEVTVPEDFGAVGPLESVGRHWWVDGSLHNMEVKWQ